MFKMNSYFSTLLKYDDTRVNNSCRDNTKLYSKTDYIACVFLRSFQDFYKSNLKNVLDDCLKLTPP